METRMENRSYYICTYYTYYGKIKMNMHNVHIIVNIFLINLIKDQNYCSKFKRKIIFR